LFQSTRPVRGATITLQLKDIKR